MVFLRLYWEFFKAGLFAIGGGMATLPFLKEIGVSTGWYSTAQLADMVAISESTPGPIGVNMATYVGFTVGGNTLGSVFGSLLGALVATLGLITPCVVIILIIAAVLDSFRGNRYVDAAFYGLRPASAALICSALISLISIVLLNTELFRSTHVITDLISLKSLLLAAVLLVLTRYVPKVKSLHPLWFILFSAAVGIVFKF